MYWFAVRGGRISVEGNALYYRPLTSHSEELLNLVPDKIRGERRTMTCCLLQKGNERSHEASHRQAAAVTENMFSGP
jgi:hypothetical protein